MQTKSEQSAILAAYRTRNRLGTLRTHPLDPVDAAEKLGVEVRFEGLNSFEGMFCRGNRCIILLGAKRPAGRIAFTCAHELGHYVLGHGTSLDELDSCDTSSNRAPEEIIADTFAAHLLMPEPVLATTMRNRKLEPSKLSPEDVYKLSVYLGAGFATLVRHMTYALSLLSRSNSETLLKEKPKSIASELVGFDTNSLVVNADEHWIGRPINLSVDDFLLLHPQAPVCISSQLEYVSINPAGLRVFRAATPGIAQVSPHSGSQSIYVRVSRRNYTGRARYRHLEE